MKRKLEIAIIGALILAMCLTFLSSCSVVKYTKDKFFPTTYKSTSKFVIQTKGQSAGSDILDSQRTVAYAQLVVGTYIDIVNTNNFAKEVAFYMNGNVKEKVLTQDAVNAFICKGILEDGGIFDTVIDENGNKINSHLKNAIILLADEGLIPYGDVEKNVYDVLHARMTARNQESLKAEGYTSEQISQIVTNRLLDIEGLLDIIEQNIDSYMEEAFCGDSEEKIELLKELGLAQGESYQDKEYTSESIRDMMSFSEPKENSIVFGITVESEDSEEAYTIAKVCEIIISDYIEEHYPGNGFIKCIETATIE